MNTYLIDRIRRYNVFSSILEDRAGRMAAAAKVDILLLRTNSENAFRYWIKDVERAISSDQHIRAGINPFQLKLEILFRALLHRKLASVTARHPVSHIQSNVVNLFDRARSPTFVDYGGQIELQRLVVENPSAYLAVDTAAHIYRELLRREGEGPFHEADQQAAAINAATYISLQPHDLPSLVKLMHLPILPVPLKQTPDSLS